MLGSVGGDEDREDGEDVGLEEEDTDEPDRYCFRVFIGRQETTEERYATCDDSTAEIRPKP